MSITTTAEDGSVWVDHVFFGEIPLTIEVEQGTHMIDIAHDGYKEWKEKVLDDGDWLAMKAEFMAK